MSDPTNRRRDRKLSKRENDAYAREMMAVREREKRRARLRRRIVTALSVTVAVLLVAAGGAYWWYRADLATYAGPKNMRSDGVLLTGSSSAVKAVTTAALAPKALPRPTDLTSRTSTVNFDLYLDLSDTNSATFLATNGATMNGWLTAGYVTIELHPLAVHDTARDGRFALRSANALACVANSEPDASLAAAVALAKAAHAKGFDGMSDAKLVATVKKAGASSDAIASCIRGQSFDRWVVLATHRATHDAIPNSSLARIATTPVVLANEHRYTGKPSSSTELYGFVQEVVAEMEASSSSSSGG